MTELEELVAKIPYGLTIEEKMRLKQLEPEYFAPLIRCRCYSLGDRCKAHGIQYEIETIP